MHISRRKFIWGTGAALVGTTMDRALADTATAPDIRNELLSSGFNPDNPNSALMAIIGDSHFTADPNHPYYTLSFDDTLVTEINGLTPAITDLAIAGDLILSHSGAIGTPRYPTSYAFAQQEFDAFKLQLPRFRSNMRLWTVPGNHDTDREETDAELWRSKLGTPPYQKSVLGGVPVFFLNSGHAGMMDPAQIQWFNSEAAAIPTDQEVLIICHFPSFAIFATYAGLKRTVATAFAGHQAPIWVMSGHNHNFREDYYLDKGTRYIQGQVTSASTKVWNDGKASGYALLGLQDGRVVTRIFRSTKVGGFQTLPSISEVGFGELRWAFDRVLYPGEVFHEGFYNRTGRILSYTAVDVKCHFMYTKMITWQVDLARFGGKIREFMVSGWIGTNARPTARCSFSSASPNGPWVDVPIPTDSASIADCVFKVAIPSQFLTAATLYVKIGTDVVPGLSDMEIAGWGVAASAETLTGYEKWIARRYGTFLSNEKTAPAAIPSGNSVSNLEIFAFNLNPTTSGNGTLPPPPSIIQGTPSFSTVLVEQPKTFQFARRKAAGHPGVSCFMEESMNLTDWSPIDPSRLTITSLDDTWEEVRLTDPVNHGFFRVRVENTYDPQGTFLPWQNSVAIPGGSPADRNANSIEDLIEYGFELSAEGNAQRLYDRNRIGSMTGHPNIGGATQTYGRMVYARMRPETNPGVDYTLEQSQDLITWTPVPEEKMAERILMTDGTWDQVECLLEIASEPRMAYRIRLELTAPLLP